MRKVFIVTGANRGLGKAFVDVLVKNKNHFIISISRSASVEQNAYPSANFRLLKIDLSDNGIGEKISVLKDLVGEQEVYFLNNACIIDPIVKIESLEEKDIDRTLSINVKAAMLITNYLLRYFSDNELTFVNISSGAASNAIENWSLYCSSKAFMKMFFDIAEKEYSQYRFFNVDPGVLDTRMQKYIRASNFPGKSDFQKLEKDGKLKSPEAAASEILNTII
ncbi:SDR family NAD(P)-dependent oxidoreductase [Pareuzebyella sediminis]|uniref:SDR family NAD(P)-dependent oxidoreductase n=1 Tax=Pareuzebyella sediminis TaxID=2607998 RepID=UPI0011EEDA94|nr:SDR family NAD(P)-dependent oxidoreductase [Pareuzebyella sediminis]